MLKHILDALLKGPTKQLIYFSSSDLLIQVNYKQEGRSLLYSSHRELTFGERVVVERYLLANIAIKTEYYNQYPAVLNYQGIEKKLIEELSRFHLKNTTKNLQDKEHAIDTSVRKLIDRSMSNYYFEQIGNVVLELREIVEDPVLGEDLSEYKCRLQDLIEAYNVYSDRKVTYQEVLPKELMPLWEQECKY